MSHEAVWRGTVPVILAGLEEDAVAGSDHLDRLAPALAEPHALGDVDRLPEGMGVPSGSRAGREVNELAALRREGSAGLAMVSM